MSLLDKLAALKKARSPEQAPLRRPDLLGPGRALPAAAPDDSARSAPVQHLESDPPRSEPSLFARLGAAKNPAMERMRLEAGMGDEIVHAHLDPAEWDRILNLPMQLELTEEQIAQISYAEMHGDAFERGERLRPIQAWGVREFDAAGGLLAQARVGTGKTMLSLLLCERGARRGIPRGLLIVPSSVYGQLVKHDLPKYRKMVPFSTRFIGLGGLSKAARLATAKRNRTGTFILTYPLLSRPETRELLDLIDPGIVVADEAQNLKRRDAARTRRFLDFMAPLKDRKPRIFCAMSGTLTAKSLRDYHHLARLSLGDRSPMPRQVGQATAWGQILDASAEPTPEQCGPLMPLRNWAMRVKGEDIPYTVDGVRESYQHRLRTAPGCVMSQADDLDVELQISAVDPGTPSKELQRMMEDVTLRWIAPTGDEISHAFHTHKWLYELSAGFYNALVWPEPRDAHHAADIERAKVHHAAEQMYARELRAFLLATSRPDLDTPMLVGNALYRGLVAQDDFGKRMLRMIPEAVQETWLHAKELEFEGMPERIAVPTQVDDYKIQAAARWCAELKPDQGAVIWFFHHEPLDWCAAELAKQLGSKVRTARAGDDSLLDPANARYIYCAAKAHAVGKNLQHFPKQLVFQWPRPAIDAEQMLGRAHRPGVEEFVGEEGSVEVDVLLGPSFDHQVFSACAADALYIQLTTGNMQKIFTATYPVRPRIYEPRLLQRLGFRGRMATAAELEERFGELTSSTRG